MEFNVEVITSNSYELLARYVRLLDDSILGAKERPGTKI